MKRRLFTSESVTEGHPDKLADQISDAILDEVLTHDPNARVAAETLVTTGLCLVAGEITTSSFVDFQTVARRTIERVGYDDARAGYDYNTCAVLASIDEQSPDIALGVDKDGAGDQGMMFGYACRETPELMPMPIMISHRLCKRLADSRKTGELSWLRPDGKAQVSVEYEDLEPKRISSVVVSTQHSDDVTLDELRAEIKEKIVTPVCPSGMIDDATDFHINPTGRFVVGGPQGDCGLTGRKIIVDTYGGMGRHGGGAFSGKDSTKVDRSACYMARMVAKNVVAAELADRCEVQLAYAIGVADPVSVRVMTYGTAKVPEHQIEDAIKDVFPLTPKGIIDYLELRRPIFSATAAYGHFGRSEPEFTWESTRAVDALRGAVKG